MNRSLLLVICDFLLLSLLALARFDDPEGEQEPAEAERAIQEDAAANQDLIDVLKMSLDAEQESRAEISSELQETREALEARAKALAEREAKLEQTQQVAEQLASEKERLENQRTELAAAKAKADQERERLARQSEEARQKLEDAERDRVALAKTLADVKESAATSSERLKAIQDELAEKEAAVSALQSEREQLASQVKVAELQKQKLATELEVTKAEARSAVESLEVARRDIELTREEKKAIQQTTQTLAMGVGQLAEETGQIREEVKRAQPLSLNAIFDRFQQNKVQVTFQATESGFLGSSQRTDRVDTVLVRHGELLFALLPVSQTPLDVSGLQAVDGTIQIGARAFRFKSVGVLTADPRILAVALPESVLEGAGVEAFPLASDPLKFPQAVLIDGERNFYGEVRFKLQPGRPEYLAMDSSIFNDLFGEFAPGRGDFVFSQTGALIGVMVNDDYAVAIPNVGFAQKMAIGEAFNPAELNRYRNQISANAATLPSGLR